MKGIVGFGGYRVSDKSAGHENALRHALEQGISFIDTSSNYTNGESEKLIGKVLHSFEGDKPFLISKVGYIQGKNLEYLKELHEKNLALNDLVDVSADLKHSIHPEFIEDQIKRSLERLQVESLDCYLLHNPEYYLKEENSSKDEFYQRIALAFNKFEELIERGLIKSYGVSSNTLIDPLEDKTTVSLDLLFEQARKIKENHGFKVIQFPMNLLEMGALERQYEGEHLLERAKSYNLKSIINRPLNSFSDHGLVRFAKYEVNEVYQGHKNADYLFNKHIESLVIKWLEVREDEGDKLFDIPLMQQIQNIWYKQNSQDAVSQVFMQYFFPLVANIWGRDMTPSESAPFYALYEHGIEFAKFNMTKRAEQFETQALDKGLLFENDKTLSQKAIEKYVSMGVEYILVGMRDRIYVDDLKEFF